MSNYSTKVVTDENNKPVEVIIKYEDWQEITRKLGINQDADEITDISMFEGILKVKPGEPDPLEFQKNIRKEWE